jgi:hypothetical protein
MAAPRTPEGAADARLIARAPDLLAENARLREALEFYAVADHYERHPIDLELPVVLEDDGDRARAALKEVQP